MFGAIGLVMGIIFVGFGMGGFETASTWDEWKFCLLFVVVGLVMMQVSADVMKEDHK